jgi:Uma2 family endonuclease
MLRRMGAFSITFEFDRIGGTIRETCVGREIPLPGPISSIRRGSMSIAVRSRSHYTPEDLLAMPEGNGYELLDGQLVERKTGAESSWVGGRLFVRIARYCEAHGLDWAFPADNGYQCFPHNSGLVRRPDVSFVRKDRLPGGRLPRGWIKIPPDLAIEVLSPNDTAYEVDGKLEDYLKVGVPLVWLINPDSRTVRVHRGDGSASYLHEDGELSGEDIVPGFRCPLREILAPREVPPDTEGSR